VIAKIFDLLLFGRYVLGVMVLLYYPIVNLGIESMKGRKPFDLTTPLLLWRFLVVLLSAYVAMYKFLVDFVCEPNIQTFFFQEACVQPCRTRFPERFVLCVAPLFFIYHLDSSS